MARKKKSFADRVISGEYANIDSFSTNKSIEENIIEPTIKASKSSTGLKKIDIDKYPKYKVVDLDYDKDEFYDLKKKNKENSNKIQDKIQKEVDKLKDRTDKEEKNDSEKLRKDFEKLKIEINEQNKKNDNTVKNVNVSAYKKYSEKEKEYHKARKNYQKELEKAYKEEGVNLDNRLGISRENDKMTYLDGNDRISYQAKEIDKNNGILKTSEKAPAIAKVFEKVKKAREEADKRLNELDFAKYQKNVADINAEETTWYDKTIGNIVRGAADLGSILDIESQKYTTPEGKEVYLPTKNELMQQKVSDSYNNKVTKFLGDVAYNVSKIGTAQAINPLTGGIGGTAAYWSDMFADSYKNAKNQGYEDKNALAYSTVSTAAEYVTGKLLGSATKELTGGKSSGLSNAISNATNKLLKNPKVANIIGNAGSEATEEFVQEYVDNLNRLVTLEGSTNIKDYADVFTDKDILQDALYSAGVGAFSGVATNIKDNKGNIVKDNIAMMQDFKDQLVNSKSQTDDTKKIEKYDKAIELVDNYLANPFKDVREVNDELVNSYNSITPELQTQMQTQTQINPQQSVEEVRKQFIQNQVNAFNLNKNQNKTISPGKPGFIQSARNYNIKVDNDTIQSINKITSERGIKASFDDTQFNNANVNALWRINDDGTREVVFNPNANTKDLMENVAVHELYHDIANQQGNNYLQDLVLDMVSTKEGYLKARESLVNEYAKVYDTNNPNFNNIVNEEAVASILGEKLGNQEFINQLTTERRSVAKVIYDSVVNILNKLNKLTGYKSEKIYWTDVKNKFEKAYKNNSKNFEENTRFMVTGKKAAKQLDKNFDTKEFTKNYNDALDMEKKGFSKEKIRKETGWYKDINGDWKFEISDESAKLKIKPKANTTYKLSDLLSHDFIYDIYKNLGDTPVEFKDLKNKVQNGKSYPIYGYVNKVTGKMTLNNKYINNDSKILETLLHEIQHKIQRNEHFQSGTFIGKNKDKYDNNLGEMEARETWARKDLTLDERIDKPSFTSIYDGTNSNEKIYTKEDNKWYTIFGGNIGENFETSKEISNRTIRKNIPDVLSKELDNSSFSFEENKTWDDFVKENFKNEGTGKRLQELKEKTTSNKEQRETKLTIQEQQELNALESVPFELSKEEAKRLNELREKANGTIRFSELVNKTSYDSIKTEYGKYKNQMDNFNTKILNNAEKTIPSNKQGRRTKSEWLDVAEHVGSNINAKNAQQLEKYAIQSFLYAQPNRSNNLNRQGKKYVKFTIEEWLQRVYKGAGVGERYSLDSNAEINTTVNLKYGTSSEDVMNRISRDNQSKFYENITERSKFLTEENRNKLSQEDDIKFYDKVTNKESMNSAMKKLKNGGQSEIDSWFMKDGNHDSVDVAEGWILLKRAQESGDYNMMSSIAKKMRQMGTKSGQAVQMYNLLGRLTPEGMVKYATSELDEAWSIASRNKSKKWVTENEKNFQLTPEETKYIVDQMNKVSTMEDGYEKNVEIAKVQKLLQDKLPPEKGQGLKAWMRFSMLFNLKTQIRNVLGNAVITPVNALSDTFASIVDKRITKKTGIRTTGGINKGYLKGFKEGLYQSYNDFKLGINTRNVQGNRFEVGQGKSFNEHHTGALAKQRNIVSKAFNRIDSLLSFVLDAGDRGFYEASFVNSINNQKVLNNMNEVTQEMLDIATNEALSRTWQDNNNYTKFVLEARSNLNKLFNIKGYGIGDVLIPFAKTPANLTKAIVDYSPIGLVKTLTADAKKLKNNISTGTVTSSQQHQFVQNLGKATAGTMLYIAGMALAQAGITTGANDEDKEVSDFMKNTLGIQPYSIRIGNRSFTYDWAQPIAAPFAITANINKALSDEEMTLTDAILTTLDSGFNILMEQSFVSGLQNVLNTSYGSIVENIGDQILGLPARAVPTFIKHINDLIDPYTRQVYENDEPLESAKNQVKTKLPKASKDLPVKRDTLGRKVEKYGGENNIFNVFLNPANTTKGKVSDSAKVIYEVYQKTKDKTIMPRQPAPILGLNNAEKSEFLKISGGIIEKNVKKLENNYYYKKLDDEDKAEAIKGIVNYAYNKAKSEVMSTDMATTYNTANKALKSGITLYDYYAKRVYENR